MKIFVIVVGLFAIVAPKDPPRSAEILFLETEGQQTPRHELRVHYAKPTVSGAVLVEVNFGTGVDLEIVGSSANGEVVLDESKASFTRLDQVLGTGNIEVRPECTGTAALESCKTSSGATLVTARLELRGGRLRPAEVQGLEIEIDADTLAEELRQWEFRALDADSGSGHFRSRPLNGILFEASLTSSLTLERPVGDPVILEPTEHVLCTELAEKIGIPSEPCTVLLITNSVTAGDHSGDDPIDEEFGLVYDLLARSLTSRPVPHVVLGIDEDPPESRCVPPLLQF